MSCTRHTICCLLLFLCCACGQSGKKAQPFKALSFPLVNVPVMLEEDQRLDYLVEHFFDAFTAPDRHFPSDSLLIGGVEKGEVEQAFANYTMLMEQVPLDQARAGITRLAERLVCCEMADTTQGFLAAFGAVVERYLYDPNSPMRDEDIYAAYASVMASCPLKDATSRERYAGEAEMCSLNSRGSRAADFTFSDRNGKVHSLYGVKAEYTVLFFSNPGCTACKEIIDNLVMASFIDENIRQKRLAIVNVYIDDSIDEWYSYMSAYPKSWYNGFDHNQVIRTENLYNVRAIPSLYLLDSEKNVILKDCTPERLFASLDAIL